jgi:hypothetical protein
MGPAKSGKSHGLMGTVHGLAHRESAGQVSELVSIPTDPFQLSKPGPLPGYLDLFPILVAG